MVGPELDGANCRSDVVGALASLPGPVDRQARTREGRGDHGREDGGGGGTVTGVPRCHPVLHERDRLLERRCPLDELHGTRDVDPLRQCRRQRGGERVEVDRPRELDIEVLGVALVTHREREAEAHLRTRREAERERQWELLDTERPLERARHVAMRHEPHLPALGEPDAHREPRIAPHLVALAAAGDTPAAVARCSCELPAVAARNSSPCPVPWLPPAGAVAEATTCSRA